MIDDIRFETDEIYEIWDGEKVMMSPRSPRHESVLTRIIMSVSSFVYEHHLGAIYSSNAAVYLGGDAHQRDFVMPDIVFVSKRNRNIVRETGIFGAPDLVVEVVSPGLSNTRRDVVDKFRKYEQAGVAEYWLVDPVTQELELYSLQKGKYERVDRSVVLNGLELDEAFIFAEDFAD